MNESASTLFLFFIHIPKLRPEKLKMKKKDPCDGAKRRTILHLTRKMPLLRHVDIFDNVLTPSLTQYITEGVNMSKQNLNLYKKNCTNVLKIRHTLLPISSSGLKTQLTALRNPRLSDTGHAIP